MLHVFEGRLFLDDELLANKGELKVGLTYTDELTISFENQEMIINMNGNILRGSKK